MKTTTNSNKISTLSIGLAVLSFLAVATSSPAQTQPCIETNGYKFIQLPNLSSGNGGMDVKDSRNNIVLADDFLCTSSGPITDIHIWGSWLNDIHGLVTNFWIGIYSDVPAVTGPVGQIPSHPGTLLWWTNFPQGQYAETINEPPGEEYFYNPTNNTIMGGDTQAWYYCFYPAQPFMQQGTASNPTNYWLAVRAQLDSQTTQLFGWKNSVSKYNDAAVWGTVDASGLPSGNWQPMTNPITSQQMDLAFKLTTPTNTPPPVQCVETNGVKTIQGPNVLGGFDVWNTPYVLADDFVCNFRGPVTDIHLWGSWLADQALTGSITFWLGIYDDVPVGPGNTSSHPGTNLLWQQWFAPGQYAETIWTANAQEQFLNPGTSNVLGSDSVVWYYCFYPTNPFAQLGTATAPKTYWLAAYAQLPVGIPNNYGWKTTTNVLHDISVHAVWPGVAPTNNPGWTPTAWQPPAGGPPVPLDLAFKLTTPTNVCGGPAITYLSTNAEVLTWPGGFLQSSTNVIGPYVDVPGAISPYTNTALMPPYQFYRLRCY